MKKLFLILVVVAAAFGGIREVSLTPQDGNLAGKYSDGDVLVALCNATSGAFTVIIPPPNSAKNVSIHLKKTDSTSNAVSLRCSDFNRFKIDSSDSVTLSNQHESVSLLPHSTGWYKENFPVSLTGDSTYLPATYIGYGATADTLTGDANLTWDSYGQILSASNILIGNGAVGAPSLAFTSETNSGICFINADDWGLVCDGENHITLHNGSFADRYTQFNKRIQVNTVGSSEYPAIGLKIDGEFDNGFQTAGIGGATAGNISCVIRSVGMAQFYRDGSDYQIRIREGTVNAPSFSWLNNNTDGMYSIASNYIGFALNGVKEFEMQPGGHFALVGDNQEIQFGGSYDSRIYDDGSDLNYDCDKLLATGRTHVFSGGNVVTDSKFRASTSSYRRYYHFDINAFNPGLSGATWTAPDGNTLGGYKLDNAGEILYGKTEVHSDWDGASDANIELSFECNVDNSGGNASDSVSIKIVLYYKGAGESVNKSQTVEVHTTIGACAQYTLFHADFPIDFDASSNELEVGDKITAIINLETDTSIIDNIIINDGSFYYNKTHAGIEDGDI